MNTEPKRTISFSPPDMSELEINEVADCLRSGWITTGPRTKKLEKELKEYVGADGLVCLNSATASEELSLRILGIGEGDEVIVPAYTYTSSAAAAIHVGATVKFVDCAGYVNGRGVLEMDYSKVADAITEKTKAIIPVDLGGVPCDYDRIFEIVEEKKNLFNPKSNYTTDLDKLGARIQEKIGRVVIVADGAHALGTEWKGRKVGSIADFTSFSFHAVKNFTTAEGGAASWRHIDGIDDEEIYHWFQLLSLHGQSKDALAKTKLGAWEYDIVAPLFKCNMGDLIFKLLEINQKVTEAKINAVKESDLKALEILQKMVSEYNILLIVDIVFFFILVVGMVLLLLGTKLKAFEPGFLLKKDIYSLNELTQARLLGYYYNDFSSSNNRMLERKFRIFNILSVLFIPVTVISFFLAYFSTVILR